MPEPATPADDRCLAGLAAALAALPGAAIERVLAGFAEALAVEAVVLLDLEPTAVRALAARERRALPEPEPTLPAGVLAALLEGRLARGGRELATALVRTQEPPGAALIAPLPALAGPPTAALALVAGLSGWTWSNGQEQALRGLAGGLAGWLAARGLQSVLDALPTRIAWKDPGLRVRAANRAWRSAYGPLLGRALPGDDDRRERDVLAGGPAQVQRLETTALPGGREQWACVSRVALDGGGLVVARDDITAAIGLAGQLAQAHRTAAIGRLAAGVAADLRPLAAQIAADVAAARSDDADALARIDLAARAADDLARQLAAFSRRQIAQPVDIVPVQLLTRMEPTLARLLGDRAELRLAPVGLRCLVRVDPRQFEQLLVLLVRHAGELLTEDGRVDVDVSPDSPDPDAAAHLALTPGEYVRVRLVATPARLADGEHGLRLALARTIAAFAGGAVQQLADADAVRLDLRLPRVFTTPRPEPDAPRTTLDVRGGEALLLVDDDAVVRPILATVLRHLGYDVHVADDLDAAVQSLETGLIGQVPSARIALALVSTALSGPEPPDALRRLRTCLPDLRVLWIAPHAPAAFSAPALAVGASAPAGTVDPLVVPCSFEALAVRVRQALDARV